MNRVDCYDTNFAQRKTILDSRVGLCRCFRYTYRSFKVFSLLILSNLLSCYTAWDLSVVCRLVMSGYTSLILLAVVVDVYRGERLLERPVIIRIGYKYNRDER